jgi:6-bladed beta-propeller
MVRATPRWGAVSLLAMIAGCGTGTSRNELTVGDSAGIRIVEYGDATPAPEHWSVDPSPVLEVGKTEGDEGYLLTRVVHAGTLINGELLVADGGTEDLRVFDSTGTLLRRFGRSGEGPGEFRALNWVGIDPSGIVAQDLSLRRFSRFGPTGDLQGTFPEPPLPGSMSGVAVGRFDDGSILVRSSVGLPSDPSQLETGLVRDSLGLFLVAHDGSTARSVGTFPGSELVRAVGNGHAVFQQPAPFGLGTVTAVGDSGYYVGTQERYEIRGYRPDGRLREIVRRAGAPTPIPAAIREHWEALHDSTVARLEAKSTPPFIVEAVKYHTLPKALPAFGDVRVDRVGNLWVEDYRPFPKEDSVTTWTVFGSDGALKATATLSTEQITEIGADHVVAVRRDDNGVPHVREYRLVKGGRADSDRPGR